MERFIINVDREKAYGAFKRLNAVNNGPVHKRHSPDQFRSNLQAYKEAKIPYARNHDAAFCADYGGEHSVDISGVFPDFDADPYDPASYNFATTDEYILITLEAGTQTFYRLGQKIEHYVKKYDTLPPKDFKKWAVVCEHIISHYNEGWANGYELGIKYWEIWNEADLDPDDSTNKRTWGGTKAQYFELYGITAKHLKSCFPDLRIGGPSLAGKLWWAEDFLREMSAKNVPIDFFSWHTYTVDPYAAIAKSFEIKALLEKYGYGGAENILNEWNYVRGWWADDFRYSVETIIGMKGAAFTMAVMSLAQPSPIDMLMYYDARPSAFNGLFDMYFLDRLKGYYPFKWYGFFYGLEEIRAVCPDRDFYTLCGKDADGKLRMIVTYYTEDDDKAQSKTVYIEAGGAGKYRAFLLDKSHDGDLICETENPEFTMEPNTCVMLVEV